MKKFNMVFGGLSLLLAYTCLIMVPADARYGWISAVCGWSVALLWVYKYKG
jgi:hypothetical protein